MFCDIHLHHKPGKKEVDTSQLLAVMDKTGVEKIALFSWYGANLEEQEENIRQVEKIFSAAPDRIYGLAWIEPAHGTKLEFLVELVQRHKFRGFKMIPNKWYPCEEKILSFCQTIAELNVPCLFHSGILYFSTFSSRYCRPVFFEECLKIKDLRFALAHLSWPWTDECIAFYGQWRSLFQKGEISSRLFLDSTAGTPPAWRRDVFEKVLSFGASEALIFGTDMLVSGEEGILETLATSWQEHFQRDKHLCEKLNFSAAQQTEFFTGNFEKFFSG